MSYKDDLLMKIATSNECDLVALQYQALIELTEDLKKSIDGKEYDSSDEILDKIRDIISNLMASLSTDEFSQKTKSIYLYINNQLTKQFIDKNTDKIDTIINIFSQLRDAWSSVGANFKSEINKNVTNLGTYGKKDINVQGSLGDFGKA